MVEIKDIVDRVNLEEWLKDQPREVSVWIAWRAAMRVLPVWWEYVLKFGDGKQGHLMALPVLRSNLISGAVWKIQSTEIKNAAFAAANAGFMTPDDTAANAGEAAYAAGHASIDLNTKSNAAAAADLAADAVVHAANIWQLTRADCEAVGEGEDLDSLKLWVDSGNPIADVWARVKAKLSVADPPHSHESAPKTTRGATPVDWSFWIKWYDSVLAGEPLNGGMLEEIALIEPAEWGAGALHINNEVIAGIVEKYRLLREVKDLRKGLAPVRQMATVAAMGHNNPPEGIDTEAEAVVVTQTEIIWAALGEAEEELSKPEPSPSVLKRAGAAILGALKSVLMYVGKLGDVGLKAAAATVGGGVGAYLISKVPEIQSFAERAIEFAVKYLH